MSLEEIDLHNDNLFNTIKQTLAMIVFDIHGQILWANDKFSNVVGYDVEELTKMHHYKRIKHFMIKWNAFKKMGKLSGLMPCIHLL